MKTHFKTFNSRNSCLHLFVGDLEGEARAVAAWIGRELPGQQILLDTVHGYGIWPYVAHSEQFIIVSDRDYAAILAEPRGQADYLLVPSPRVEAADSINTR